VEDVGRDDDDCVELVGICVDEALPVGLVRRKREDAFLEELLGKPVRRR
jgi:hypothetical protein